MYAESQTANQEPGNFKLCEPFYERTPIGRNPVVLFQKREKERIRKKSEVQKKE